MDENQTIDVYYDMDIAQICQHFNKTRNTVDKAVAKLVKDYPDKDYKYKNPDTKRITIKAEGVEKLSTYFRKEKNEISTVEEKDRSQKLLEQLYQEKLKLEIEKSKQTFLIEQQTKEEQIQKLETEKSELIKENQNLQQKIEDVSELQKELEEHKKKESEYNSKSFFYRLLHKI